MKHQPFSHENSCIGQIIFDRIRYTNAKGVSPVAKYTDEQLIELLIASYPDGISTPEIAQRLGGSRQTAHNRIMGLRAKGLYQFDDLLEEKKRYAIIPPRSLERLNLTEAWMLYLPLRRLTRTQRHRSVIVNSLLSKVTTILNPIIAENLLLDVQLDMPKQDNIFREITTAWRDGYCLDIVYKPLNRSTSRHLIAPYWLEPSVWSDAAYLVAGLVSSNKDELQPVTLKLGRINQAIPRSEYPFKRPDPALILERLSMTWGIWLADEPVLVTLRFANRARERLLETRWHPTQEITDQDDGTVLWQAEIAEPQEMMPWIRGWGSDVEVLAPSNIREEIGIDADRTARKYGWCGGDEDAYF